MHENYENNGVPAFNFDRAQTIASIERMKQIVGNVKATVTMNEAIRIAVLNFVHETVTFLPNDSEDSV